MLPAALASSTTGICSAGWAGCHCRTHWWQWVFPATSHLPGPADGHPASSSPARVGDSKGWFMRRFAAPGLPSPPSAKRFAILSRYPNRAVAGAPGCSDLDDLQTCVEPRGVGYPAPGPPGKPMGGCYAAGAGNIARWQGVGKWIGSWQKIRSCSGGRGPPAVAC